MSKRKWETVSEVCERWQERYRRKGFGSDTLPPLLDGVMLASLAGSGAPVYPAVVMLDRWSICTATPSHPNDDRGVHARA